MGNIAAMSLMRCFTILGVAIAIVFAFLTYFKVWFAYICSVIVFLILVLIILAIPLEINWSKNLYASILIRSLIFPFFSIFIYAICYKLHPSFTTSIDSFFDALYFSTTTWTTLGYGDIAPSGDIRLLTSLEALTGLISTSILTAVIWFYCSSRLQKKSLEEKQMKTDLNLVLDHSLGVFREQESEHTLIEQKNRDKLFLKPCKQCKNSDLKIEKYFDVIGVLTPLSNFIVSCKCGKFSKPQKNAYLAALTWNFKN